MYMYTATINGRCYKFDSRQQYSNFCKAVTTQATTFTSLGYTSFVVCNGRDDVVRPRGLYIVNGIPVVFSA